MPEQEDFREIVKIEWDISQPEGAIGRLLAQLADLERRFADVSRAAANAGRAAGGGDYAPPPAGAEYVTQRRYPAGTPGGLGGRYAPAGFDNVSRSGESPSGIGAQYIGDGPMPRYRFVDNGASMAWASANASYAAGFSQNTGWASNAFLLGSGPSAPNWIFSSGGPTGLMPSGGGAFSGTPPLLLGAGGGGQFGAGWGGFAGGWGGGGGSWASTATINNGAGGGGNWWSGANAGWNGAQQQPLPATPWFVPPGGAGAGGAGFPPFGGGPGVPGGPAAAGAAAAGNAFSLFDNRFARHIAWIAQGIAIWGALHVAMDTVKATLAEIANMENVQARIGFINGTNMAGVAGQVAAGAQYGLTSAQAGAGAIVGGQLGSSQQDMASARQLALVFGTDQYTNALTELYQTQQRANAVGVQHVAVMDYIATAYKTAPGSLETYFDSLQQGILLSKDLGVASEQAGLSILKMATATEDSPERIATTIQSVIGNLRKGPVQDELKGYGITAGDPSTMLRAISTEVTNLVASGNVEKAKALIDVVTGGLNGPARQLQLLTDFQELNKLFGDLNPQLSTMDELLKNIGETGSSTFDRLKSSFVAYADAIIAASKKEAGGTAQTGLQAIAQTELANFGPVALLSLANPGKAMAEQYARNVTMSDSLGKWFLDQANRTNYETDTGLNSRMVKPGIARRPTGADWTDTSGYRAYLREQSGEGVGFSKSSLFGDRPITGGGEPTPAPTYEFGGFQTAPKGWDWDKFTKDVRNQETLLSGVKGYTVDQKQVAFWDEATQSYKTMIGDLNAIRFATDEQRKLLQQQITGTFNVPAGGEVLVQYFALAAGLGPSTGGNKAGSGGGTNVSGSNNAWNNVYNYMTGTNDPWGPNTHSTGPGLSGDDYAGIPDAARGNGGIHKMAENEMKKMKKGGDLFAPGGGASTTGSFGKDEFGKKSDNQAGKLQALTVNNTIRVYIDGRQVSHVVQRQNYRSFENIRNSAFTAPSSQVAV